MKEEERWVDDRLINAARDGGGGVDESKGIDKEEQKATWRDSIYYF